MLHFIIALYNLADKFIAISTLGINSNGFLIKQVLVS